MALGPTAHNLVLAVFVAAAAFFVFFWGCPYLAIFGHQKLCIALYAVLLLIYIFGRASGTRRRATGND